MKKKLFLITFLVLSINLQSQELKNKLTLRDCVNLALENNLDIKIEKFNIDAGRKDIEIEKSYFDKNLSLELNKNYSKRASTSTLQGAPAPESKGLNSYFTISQKLYSGTNYSLRFNFQTEKSNSKFAILNPYYQSDINLSFTHPLMEGSGIDINRTNLEIANIQLEIENLKLKQKIIEIINTVETSYYNLLFAKENLKVKEEELKSAKELEKEIREKVKAGILPKSDILTGEVKVFQKEAELIEAKTNYQKAMDNLLSLIYPESKNESIDIGNLQEISNKEIFFEEEKEYALLNRPDYQILKKNLQIQEINLKFAKNQKLPNLDLILNFGLQGLKGNIGDAIKDIENADFYNYQIGVKLRYPLGNRESKEKFEKENIRKEQILLSLKNLEIKINKEIQDAIRDIKSAKERLIAEKKSVELSFQNLQKEKEKFRLGLSTIFNVLQYEDNYNNAKARELKAIIDYNIAVSNLNKVTGKNILEYK